MSLDTMRPGDDLIYRGRNIKDFSKEELIDAIKMLYKMREEELASKDSVIEMYALAAKRRGS